MRKAICIIVLTLIAIGVVNGQSAQSAQERYEEFRRRANNDYERFRTEALNNYANFLEQAWQDFEVISGHRRDNIPKPSSQPTINEEEKALIQIEGRILQTEEAKPDTTNAWFSNLQWEGSHLKRIIDKSVDWVRNSSVKISTTVISLKDIAKERRKNISTRLKTLDSDGDYVSPSELKRRKKETAANNQLANNTLNATSKVSEQHQADLRNANTGTTNTPKTISSVTTITEDYSTIEFNLYGLDISIEKPGIEPQAFTTTLQQQIATYWKNINNANLNTVIEELTEISLLYNLGDWCTFKAVEQYATVWAGEHNNAKNVMMQYLLLNMGYDVRLAEADGNVILLLPFEQQVYGRPYVTLEDKRYYLYPHGGNAIGLIKTGILPKELVCDQINLIKNDPIILPIDEKAFTIEHGDIRVTGNINLNVIRMQQDYPQMDTPNYAASIHDDIVHLSIVEQLKKQLQDQPEQVAANALLHFVEHGFEYKTDRDQFGEGVEKPFFFEEILFHPYCDCEDRSIFYSYIVKQVLGLDVVLVHFPGHACTAVAFNEQPTHSTVAYTYKGKRYYICDPTYITADVGMCMPNYSEADPIFQEWYHIEDFSM